MLHPQILNQNQINVLGKLTFDKNNGIYLAGGTALALYLNHRTSVDLDFYSEKEIDNNIILANLQKHFEKTVVTVQQKNTLIANIEGVDFSLFHYPYNLIGKTTPFQNIEVASIEDVAAMKIGALVQRGRRRDFIDLYYLLKEFSLNEILRFTLKKFPGYQEMLVLRALIFFDDAEDEDLQRGVKVFNINFSWGEAKKTIFEEVKKFQLSMLKK